MSQFYSATFVNQIVIESKLRGMTTAEIKNKIIEYQKSIGWTFTESRSANKTIEINNYTSIFMCADYCLGMPILSNEMVYLSSHQVDDNGIKIHYSVSCKAKLEKISDGIITIVNDLDSRETNFIIDNKEVQFLSEIIYFC